MTQAKAQGVDVTLDVRDTGGDPATALKEIQSLREAGIATVIGPQTSSEAKEVLSFADEQGMLVVSQSSTASTLAIPGDALFRMIPTDQVEGVASGDLTGSIDMPWMLRGGRSSNWPSLKLIGLPFRVFGPSYST